jgi:hypothetical protein
MALFFRAFPRLPTGLKPGLGTFLGPFILRVTDATPNVSSDISQAPYGLHLK